MFTVPLSQSCNIEGLGLPLSVPSIMNHRRREGVTEYTTATRKERSRMKFTVTPNRSHRPGSSVPASCATDSTLVVKRSVKLGPVPVLYSCPLLHRRFPRLSPCVSWLSSTSFLQPPLARPAARFTHAGPLVVKMADLCRARAYTTSHPGIQHASPLDRRTRRFFFYFSQLSAARIQLCAPAQCKRVLFRPRATFSALRREGSSERRSNQDPRWRRTGERVVSSRRATPA